eukprot:2759260-Pleurochrysis_carterae.AAC.1
MRSRQRNRASRVWKGGREEDSAQLGKGWRKQSRTLQRRKPTFLYDLPTLTRVERCLRGCALSHYR